MVGYELYYGLECRKNVSKYLIVATLMFLGDYDLSPALSKGEGEVE